MSATVWRAIVKSTGEEVAVKNLDLESLTCSIDEIVREVRRFSPCFAWLWGAETPVAVADPPSPEFLPCSSPFSPGAHHAVIAASESITVVLFFCA